MGANKRVQPLVQRRVLLNGLNGEVLGRVRVWRDVVEVVELRVRI